MIRAQVLRDEKLKVKHVKEGPGGGGDLPAAMADAVHEWLLDRSQPLAAVLSSHPSRLACAKYLNAEDIRSSSVINNALQDKRPGFTTAAKTEQYLSNVTDGEATAANGNPDVMYLAAHVPTPDDKAAIGPTSYNSLRDTESIAILNAFIARKVMSQKVNGKSEASFDGRVAVVAVAGGPGAKYIARDGEPLCSPDMDVGEARQRGWDELARNTWGKVKFINDHLLGGGTFESVDYGGDMCTGLEGLRCNLISGDFHKLTRDHTALIGSLVASYIFPKTTFELTVRGPGIDGHMSTCDVVGHLKACGMERVTNAAASAKEDSFAEFHLENEDVFGEMDHYKDGRALWMWVQTKNRDVPRDVRQANLLKSVTKRFERRKNGEAPTAEQFDVDDAASTWSCTLAPSFGGLIPLVATGVQSNESEWFVKLLLYIATKLDESALRFRPSSHDVHAIVEAGRVAKRYLMLARAVDFERLGKRMKGPNFEPLETVLQKLAEKQLAAVDTDANEDTKTIAIIPPRDGLIYVGCSGPNIVLMLNPDGKEDACINFFSGNAEERTAMYEKLRRFSRSADKQRLFLKYVLDMLDSYIQRAKASREHSSSSPPLHLYEEYLQMVKERFYKDEPGLSLSFVCQTWDKDTQLANFSVPSPHFQPLFHFEYDVGHQKGLVAESLLRIHMANRMEPEYPNAFCIVYDDEHEHEHEHEHTPMVI